MKAHIDDVQIIKQNGKAAFAVIPYDTYLDLIGEEVEMESEVYIPFEVAELVLMEELSLLAAWRKHLGLSQSELAERMGITQSTLSQMEKINSKPQRRTLEKAAKALGVQPEQLTD